MLRSIYPLVCTTLISSVLLFAGCGDDKPKDRPVEVVQQTQAEADVIARVGDEVITFSQLNSMLNSTAMVGMAIPELGSPERNRAMISLLDKAISANLLYLDAISKGIDRLPSYTEDVHRFEDAIVASLYKSRVMLGESQVSEMEVLHYYNTQTSKESELTDDVKRKIVAIIRENKLDDLNATLHDRLREDVRVVINRKVLSAAYDDKRADTDVVASYDNHRISWSQVKDFMQVTDSRAASTPSYINDDQERLNRLEQFIDSVIMTVKGRAAGFDKDPVYIERSEEYRKSRLVNEHRNGLMHSWNPSDEDLSSYFAANRDNIVLPPARRLQQVVLKTREQAEAVRLQLETGELNMVQAAQQYSIDPNARMTGGEMGWVSKGDVIEGLDNIIFSLEPGVVSEPLETADGWHLVRVTEVAAARFDRLDDPQTRQRTFRAYMQDRFNAYVVDLRENDFKVSVYHEELKRQFQREADFIADLKAQQAQQQGNVSGQTVEQLQQQITTQPQQ